MLINWIYPRTNRVTVIIWVLTSSGNLRPPIGLARQFPRSVKISQSATTSGSPATNDILSISFVLKELKMFRLNWLSRVKWMKWNKLPLFHSYIIIIQSTFILLLQHRIHFMSKHNFSWILAWKKKHGFLIFHQSWAEM